MNVVFWNNDFLPGQTGEPADKFALQPPSYLLGIFTHANLCLADAIHNFKGVKIIQIWQNRGQLFWNLAGWCDALCLKGGIQCASKDIKKNRI